MAVKQSRTENVLTLFHVFVPMFDAREATLSRLCSVLGSTTIKSYKKLATGARSAIDTGLEQMKQKRKLKMSFAQPGEKQANRGSNCFLQPPN